MFQDMSDPEKYEPPLNNSATCGGPMCFARNASHQAHHIFGRKTPPHVVREFRTESSLNHVIHLMHLWNRIATVHTAERCQPVVRIKRPQRSLPSDFDTLTFRKGQ